MQTVAVIFGGRSAEHDISIVTALASIIKPLEITNRYRVVPVYIAKDGAWYSSSRLKDITLFTTGKVDELLRKSKPVSVQFDGGMNLLFSSGFGGRQVVQKIDVVFPAMHGTHGEDGSLMGLLEMANVPYVGCGLSASVLAMDKVLAKQIAEANNVPVARYIYLKKELIDQTPSKALNNVEKKLKYPLFIKPSHLGSSIGIGRAESRSQLQNALEVAAHYDETILVEEEVQNLIEVTLPIMGNDQLQIALLERPMTQTEDFFDFDTKYLRGGKKGSKSAAKGIHGYSELPAKLDTVLYQKTENIGKAAYRALGCEGIARVDMLIDSNKNEVYFNEINPLPGDLYRHNWQVAGVSNVDLVQNLISLATDRHNKNQQITTTFGTNFLQQF